MVKWSSPGTDNQNRETFFLVLFFFSYFFPSLSPLFLFVIVVPAVLFLFLLYIRVPGGRRKGG